jgi:hypothetical protein
MAVTMRQSLIVQFHILMIAVKVMLSQIVNATLRQNIIVAEGLVADTAVRLVGFD